MATDQELNLTVQKAKEAYKDWSKTPVHQRVRYLMTYQQLLKDHIDEIAEVLCLDTGKTKEDTKIQVYKTCSFCLKIRRDFFKCGSVLGMMVDDFMECNGWDYRGLPESDE